MLVLATVTPAVGLAAAQDDTPNRFAEGLSEAAAETGGIVQYSIPDDAATGGAETDPHWIVTLESSEDLSALRDWASTDRRTILSVDNSTNQTVVRAPPSAVGTSMLDSLLGGGLATAGYVERVDLQMIHSVPEQPDPMATEEFESPRILPDLVAPGSFDQTGVAYSGDFNQSTLGDVRESINATNTTATGENVTIAILDTGINTANGQVFGNGTAGSQVRIDAARNFVDDTDATAANDWENVSDGDGHGTWVAAAAAANHANDSYDGMAPDASLVIGKVLADVGSGTTTDIVDAVHWACEEQNADVVSMSLGGLTYSATLADAVEECAVEHNTTIMVATGNSGITQPVGIASPADTRGDDPQSDGIIAVSATNVSNASTAGPAYFAQGGVDPGADFSNGRTAGAMPTVTAPGTAIEAPTPTEDGSVAYTTLSGTSMSTPIVSGAVALSMEGTGGQNGTVAEQRVAHSAAPVQHGGATEVGAGMVDVGALLQMPYENVPEGSYYADQRDAQTDLATARDRAHLSVGDGLFDQLADESVFGTGALLPTLEVAS